MENTEKKQEMIERFGLDPVPKELRTTTWFDYLYIQLAFSVNAGNFLVPALAVLEGGMSFFQAVLSTVMGAVVAYFFVSWLSLPGAENGIPAQYAIRSMIGMKGAQYISSPIRTVISLYWFSVQTIGGTYIVKEMSEQLFHIALPFYLISIFLAVTMAVLALIGFELIKKLTKYFIPVLLLGQGIIFYLLISADVTEGTGLFSEVNGHVSFSTFVFYSGLAFVQYISGVSSSSDMARYAKSKKQSFYGIFFGNVTGFIITAIFAAYAAVKFNHFNPFVVSTTLTESNSLLLLITITAMVSMISINLNNAYTGGFSLLNSFPGLGRVKSAILFGILGVTLSCFPSLVTEAKQYISLLGGLIIPLSSVIVTEFIIFKKSRIQIADLHFLYEKSNAFNKVAFISIMIGIILYFLLDENLSPGFLVFMFTSVLYIIFKTISLKNMTNEKKSPLSM